MEIRDLSGSALNRIASDQQQSVLPSSITSAPSTTFNFSNLLQQSIEKVNAAQQDSSIRMHDVETGASQDILGTMLASQKASISFQALVQVRNKAVSAYEEIMRMQI